MHHKSLKMQKMSERQLLTPRPSKGPSSMEAHLYESEQIIVALYKVMMAF